MECVLLPDFPTEGHLTQTDRELGRDLLIWCIASAAEKVGLDPYNVPVEIVAQIVSDLKTRDSDTVENAALEKAIKRAAQGEYAKAGAMLRALVTDRAFNSATLDEAVTGKRRQKHNASKPRPNELQCLIIEIITKKPDMTVTELLVELRNHEHVSIIDEITEDEIYFIGEDGKEVKSAPISGLKDRLTRAKKYIKSL